MDVFLFYCLQVVIQIFNAHADAGTSWDTFTKDQSYYVLCLVK